MFSKILRRTHMYLALFLTPWILMYTLSTFVMNHRGQFRALYGGPPPPLQLERELPYDGVLPPGASPKQSAIQILAGLGLDGAFNAALRRQDGALVIQRLDPIKPRRITYHPAARKITIESAPWESRAFLERMHRRRGFQHDYALEDTWAFSVDLVIAAMIFWVLSGLWMWWELKLTRKLGAVFVLSGIALFACFLVTI